jgi:hypothetical protein
MRFTLGPVLAIAVWVGAWASGVAAQSATPDLVVLSNGGRVRGVVTDFEPGVRVVVQMPDGTSRTYHGTEIAGVTFGDAAPPPSATPLPTATVPGAPLSAAPPPVAEDAGASAPTRWSSPRTFESPHGEWTNSARGWTQRLPRGPFHFGLQLEGTGLIGFRDLFQSPAFTIGGGVFGFFELTLGMTGTLRVGVALSLAPSFSFQKTDCRLGYGCDRTQAYETRSIAVGGRVLLGTDFGAGFFRVGIDGSAAVVRSGVGMELGARLELGGRLLPSRTVFPRSWLTAEGVRNARGFG